MAAVAEAVGVLSLGAGSFAFARRFGGGGALAELERANGVLERRVRELEIENKTQAARITELGARTDVALAIAPVLTMLESHETRAAHRSEATLRVLDMIAQRLGADPVNSDGG